MRVVQKIWQLFRRLLYNRPYTDGAIVNTDIAMLLDGPLTDVNSITSRGDPNDLGSSWDVTNKTGPHVNLSSK